MNKTIVVPERMVEDLRGWFEMALDWIDDYGENYPGEKADIEDLIGQLEK